MEETNRVRALYERIVPEGVRNYLRASPLAVLFVVTLAVTSLLNPMKVGIALWGLTKVAGFGYFGYVIDRNIAPNDRVHELSGMERSLALLRRALIVAACILSGGLLP